MFTFMDGLIIYKASAGSGKTYKLTEEYLGLVFGGVPFHRILAVTFTNKATAEMKERITGVLNTLASGGISPYLPYLLKYTGGDEVLLRLKAGEILNDILHNYSRFSVGTIDSFFQRIIRGFARETGLESGFELELDNMRILNKVTDLLIAETEVNDDLQRWLGRFAESRIKEGLSWNFRKDIGKLGRQVFNETFTQCRHEMNEKLSDRSFMNDYLSALYFVKRRFEERMGQKGAEALAFIEERGLSVSDFSYKSGGVAGYFEKITVKKDYEPKLRVTEALGDTEKWYSKSSLKKEEIAGAVENGLARILDEALEIYSTDYPSYVSADLVLSNFYTLGILNDIIKKIREYTEANNLFMLSDVASLLSMIIEGNDAPFVYEKTGYFYRHFMIDEFQDTSRVQWQNFAPLITDSLAEDNRNILVGDVKQSIYRWRNGDWRILAGEIERDMGHYSPHVKKLEINWRSRRTIVEFNNFMFRHAPLVMQEQFRNEYHSSNLPEDLMSRLREQIGIAYGEHSQKLPDGSGHKGGYVSVSFIKNEGSWREEAIKRLPGLLGDIRSRGYRLSDIAILVRNNGDGRDVAKALMDLQAGREDTEMLRLDFISEEFLLLQESVSVQLLLALLKFISGDQGMMNKAVIINEYCRYLGHSETVNANGHDLFGNLSGDDGKSWEKMLPDRFIESMTYLDQLSLYEMVEELIALFGLDDRVSETPYLMALQDAVLEYSRKEGGGPGQFIDWWEENSGKLSVSSSERQDAMRIMTIHKAKGLQFKVVVIPFGEWKTDHDPVHDNYLWCRPQQDPFARIELVPVRYKSAMAKSIFAYDYFNEKMQVFVDNLNLLYVASTRSEEELHLFTPLPSEKQVEKGDVKSISGLLYRILGTFSSDPAGEGNPTEGTWDEESKVFTAGSPCSYAASETAITKDVFYAGRYRVNNFREKLRLRLYGNLIFDEGEKIGSRIDHGKIMHEIFENIITADDVERAVKQKCYEGRINIRDIEEIVPEINAAIGKDEVAHWFDGSRQVINETGILLENGRIRRPDRVMIKEGEVIVVDYKFGEGVKSYYRTQVRQYMKELQKMGYSGIVGYVWYYHPGKLDEVRLND
ncbi:MAG: UvrD-helicase domain-containing protein [Bacteroidales bacterium]